MLLFPVLMPSYLGRGAALRERAGLDAAQPQLVRDACDVRGIGHVERRHHRIRRRGRPAAQVDVDVLELGRRIVHGMRGYPHGGVGEQVIGPVVHHRPRDRLRLAVVRHGVSVDLRDIAGGRLDVQVGGRDGDAVAVQNLHRHVRRVTAVRERVVHGHHARGAVLPERHVADRGRPRHQR